MTRPSADPTTTVYFKDYDRATDRYVVAYEVRQGACAVARGIHSTGYQFPFQAQAKADELNAAGASYHKGETK